MSTPTGPARERTPRSPERLGSAFPEPPAPKVRRRAAPAPVAAGLAALVLAALAAFMIPTKYSSSANLVVVPATTATPEQAASLFDTLSRGQIVATAAQVYQEDRWVSSHPGVSVTAGGVTPSAVMVVTATGSDRAAVSTALTETIKSATPTVNRAIAPYQIVQLTAAPQATSTGVSRSTLVVLAAILGLLVALAVALVQRVARQASRT